MQDRPDKLADIILIADSFTEYASFIAALRPHATAIKQALMDGIQTAMPDHLAETNDQIGEKNERLRDAFLKRKSLAAVTLLCLGYGDEVWSLLEFSSDPSLRSYIIYHLGKLGADHNALATRLELESKVSIRRALIQSLGGLDSALVSPAERSRIVTRLQTFYVNDPDPGIHGSAAWALRQWGEALPDLPIGEPVLTDEQKQRFAELTEEIVSVRQRFASSEQELPMRQAIAERKLSDHQLSYQHLSAKGWWPIIASMNPKGLSPSMPPKTSRMESM